MSNGRSNDDVIRARLRSWLDRVVDERVEDDVLAWLDGLIAQQDEFGFDPFGFQPDFLKYVTPFAQWLYRSYFRTEAHDVDRIPDGRVLLIANHSGQIPIDGLVIVASGVLDRTQPRMIRSMVEKWVPSLPFVSYFFARCGQVVGTPENCRVLLARNEGILAFPEGVRGISKTFDRRYQLESFGLGFMRLALETRTPIVPVGVIGAEEQAPSFFNVKRLARVLGIPSFPVTPTFPWLGPAGLLPLPVRYRLHFGEPMAFDGDPEDEDRVIAEKVDVVRGAVESLLATGLKARKSVFF